MNILEYYRIEKSNLLTPDNARTEIDKYLPGLLEGDHSIAAFINNAEHVAKVDDPYSLPFDFKLLLGNQLRRIRLLPDPNESTWSLQWHCDHKRFDSEDPYIPAFFSCLNGRNENPQVEVFFHSIFKKWFEVNTDNNIVVSHSNGGKAIPPSEAAEFLAQGDRQIHDLQVLPHEVRFGYREIQGDVINYQEDFVYPRQQTIVTS